MSNTLHPPIQLADEHDNEWRGGTMDEAQRYGYWHRVARVVVHDPTDDLYLLQRVPENPYYDGGLWNMTASGHVDEGESYEYAAARELAEEMGIKDLRLEEFHRYKSDHGVGERVFKRHNVTFIARVAMKFVKVRANPEEVAGVLWVPQQQLFDMAAQSLPVLTEGLIAFSDKVAEDKLLADEDNTENKRLDRNHE
jgi:isopentenyl-diphosphate delta-isomerase